jgi:DNA transformation protein
MKTVDKLPNIGTVMAKNLTEIGINSERELQQLGSQQTILKLAANGVDVCINKLYALEGAIQGIRWHQLSVERKSELKQFFSDAFTKDA